MLSLFLRAARYLLALPLCVGLSLLLPPCQQ
jgi:hypothetical protein